MENTAETSQPSVPGSSAIDHAREFVELHEQVETSVRMLDSLESFLSTFQTDLSTVSGQISDLQDRSTDIENRLKSRQRIEKPLASLLADLCIPPDLATLILDTDVGPPWLPIISDFERRLETAKSRGRVQAARDVTEVAEGLRIVAATKLRAFFLALIQPIRASVTANMQVIQTSVLLKYRSLFAFLQSHAPEVAAELQRAYAGAARLYYETGFRRYIRNLGVIKARVLEKHELIAAPVGSFERPPDAQATDSARLAHANLDGPAVTLGFMADNKSHKEPVEALFRSLFVVLMDNATSEYSFITTFFAPPMRFAAPLPPPSLPPTPGLLSPPLEESINTPGIEEGLTPRPTQGDLCTPRPRSNSVFSAAGAQAIAAAMAAPHALAKEERAALDALWKQILDPVLEYTQIFVKTALEPQPAAVPLLTMIRLLEAVMAEVAVRGCGPLESAVFALRIQMWPVFQRLMVEHADALRKLAEGTAAASFFSRGTQTTDALVTEICQRYIFMFSSMVTLTASEDETMIFSNLLRLRQELEKLVSKHCEKVVDPIARATALSNCYETLLQGLSRGARPITHPKAQSEISWWKEREEEARRKIRRGNR